MFILTGAVIGFLILLGGTIWIDNIIYALGASNLLFPYCKDYFMVLFLFIPVNILQTLSFTRPKLKKWLPQSHWI